MRAAAGLVTASPLTGLAAIPDDGFSDAPSEADVLLIIANRIDVQRQSMGIIVGLVGRRSQRVISHGAISAANPKAPDQDTLFSLGSISKVFTAVLLSEAVQRGEVRLEDPLSVHLPATVKVPRFEGRAVSMLDLATHTSGLPTLPDDFPGESDPAGRARYTAADLQRAISNLSPFPLKVTSVSLERSESAFAGRLQPSHSSPHTSLAIAGQPTAAMR